MDIGSMSIEEQIAYHKERIKELKELQVCSYCGSPNVKVRGFCANCYARFRKNGTPVPKNKYQWSKKRRDNAPKPTRRELAWKEKLCADVVVFPFVVPFDFEESVDIALGNLPDRERDVLLLRYKEGMTLGGIGEAHGVTRERARQIICKAIRRLRHPTQKKYFVIGKSHIEEMERLDREQQAKDEAELQEMKKNYAASTPIWYLDLSVRAFNLLYRNGIRTLGELDIAFGDDGDSFTKIHGCGRKSINEYERIVFKFRGNSAKTQL